MPCKLLKIVQNCMRRILLALSKAFRELTCRTLPILIKVIKALSFESLLACGGAFCLLFPFEQELLSKAFLYKLLSLDTGSGLSFANVSGFFWITLFIAFLLSMLLILFEKKLKLPGAILSA